MTNEDSDEDVAEEAHLRHSLNPVLDKLEAGEITIPMALLLPMSFIPPGDAEQEQLYQTAFTELLLDLTDDPGQRHIILNSFVSLIMSEGQTHRLEKDLAAAIIALRARGRIVSRGRGPNRFQVNRCGDYSITDLLKEADR